jgi:hypothetical protein
VRCLFEGVCNKGGTKSTFRGARTANNKTEEEIIQVGEVTK